MTSGAHKLGLLLQHRHLIRAPVGVPATLFLTQLSVNAAGKAAAEGQGIWVPTAHGGDPGEVADCRFLSGSAQVIGVIWGKQTGDQRFSFSFVFHVIPPFFCYSAFKLCFLKNQTDRTFTF